MQSLPPETRRRVLGQCDRVYLARGTVLAREGEPTSAVYLPETAVISSLATYSDGSAIEIANIGREACTGINLILGNPKNLDTNEVQVGGDALEISADGFLALMSALPEFRRALLATVQAVFYQTMVSAACNGTHGAKQRLARWLLTMWDRSEGSELHLTQEFLATILGVRRATVTEAASDLQRAGLISYARGRIRITDRKGLEGASCECYQRVRDTNDSLLPSRNGERRKS